MQIQQLQHWYSQYNSKEICLATVNGRRKFAFIDAIVVAYS